MKPGSWSRPIALISARLHPPSSEASASGRSRVPWQTGQVWVATNRWA